MHSQKHHSLWDRLTVEQIVWIGAGVVLVEWFAFGIISLLGRG